jgi:hypothetical protein
VFVTVPVPVRELVTDIVEDREPETDVVVDTDGDGVAAQTPVDSSHVRVVHCESAVHATQTTPGQ